jgi:hypothetical protein
MKSFAPTRRRRTGHFLTGLCLLAVCAISCSTQETTVPATAASTPAAPPGNAADENVSNLWTLRTSTGGLVGMAGNTRTVKLAIQRAGGKVTGSYRCEAGNSLCRNNNETGSIEGTANGNRVNLSIRVLPDASNCRYTGTLDYNGNGQYACYLQGQIVEQGTWEVTQPFGAS